MPLELDTAENLSSEFEADSIYLAVLRNAPNDCSNAIYTIYSAGCKIKALRAKTNTYIKTPVRGEDPVFVITGRPEDVSAARRELLAAADHFTQIRAARKSNAAAASAPTAVPPNIHSPVEERVTIYVRVPYRVVGLVVGPKGATIKRIQQVTSTYIVTPSRDKEPCFEVTGTPDNVERAKREIESYIAMRTGNSIADSDGESPDFAFLTTSMEPVFSPPHGQFVRKNSVPTKFLPYSSRSSTTPPSSSGFAEAEGFSDVCSSNWGGSDLTSHSSPLTSAVFGARGGSTSTFTRSDSAGSDTMFTYTGPPPMSAPAFSSGVFDFNNVRDSLPKQDPPSPTYSCGSNSSEGTSVNSPKLSQRRSACVMCHGGDVVAALVPCGHNLFCYTCASNLVNTSSHCPVCSNQVSSVLRIYTR